MDAARNEYNNPAIIAAYNAILRKEIDWLLLHYEDGNFEQLVVCASGCDGLEELKEHVYDLQRVFVAFFHAEESNGRQGFVLLNYIPPNISGVKRARALVHSRRLGMVLANHQVALTVDSIFNLTPQTVINALGGSEPTQRRQSPTREPSPVDQPRPTNRSRSHLAPSMGISFSAQEAPSHWQGGSPPNPKAKTPKRPKPITLNSVRKSFSEMYAPHMTPRQKQDAPPLPALPRSNKTNGSFATLLRRMRDTDIREDMVGMDMPPPRPPPKDDRRSPPPAP